MDSSIDSIWDDPVVDDVLKRLKTADDGEEEPPPRPTKRPRQTLFLAGSDDDSEVEPSTRQQPPPEKDINIEALFADLSDEGEASTLKPLPIIDADELERKAEARHRQSMPSLTPHAILPSSSPSRNLGGGSGRNDLDKEKEGKKPRRKPVLLDEGRLLGPNGFPQLIKDTKNFKIKGKGHEETDLNRLLQIYHFWTHQLYPKTQFRDTVQRIEKLCHSKRMTVALSVWRDEAQGVINGHKISQSDEDADILDLTQSALTSASMDNKRIALQSSMDSQDQRISLSSSPPSRPPTSASEYDNYDDDIDAFLGDASTPLTSTQPETKSGGATQEDDDLLWAAIDDTDRPPTSHPLRVSTSESSVVDEDEDMWDIVRENEAASHGKHLFESQEPAESHILASSSAEADDWDDMYV